MLIGWCCFAATVLIVSLAVHVATFLGIDPMARWPGVMFIHVAIFPPIFAAAYYVNRICGSNQEGQSRLFRATPLWLRIMTGVFFAYALVNFTTFEILNEGGVPSERDGKYVLHSHSTIIRELTEKEYHEHRTYSVRGFSGHWMLFSSAALMLLVGAARLRRHSPETPAPALAPPAGPEAAAMQTPPAADLAGRRHDADQQPEPTTVRSGCLALVLYVGCLAAVFSGQPALCVLAVPPVIIGMVLALRRWSGSSNGPFESCLGCLTLVPNVVIASFMGKLVTEFIYLAIYVGLGPALTHEVAVTFPKEGPSQLSNGEPLDNRVWSALQIFITFPLFAAGTCGLTYLAEQAGRVVEIRRRARDDRTRP